MSRDRRAPDDGWIAMRRRLMGWRPTWVTDVSAPRWFLRQLHEQSRRGKNMTCLLNRSDGYWYIIECLDSQTWEDPESWYLPILKCEGDYGEPCTPGPGHLRFLRYFCRTETRNAADIAADCARQDAKEQAATDRAIRHEAEAESKDQADDFRAYCGVRTRYVQGAQLEHNTIQP